MTDIRYEGLVDRIEVATEKLEEDILRFQRILDNTTGSVTEELIQLVRDAETYALMAEESVTNAAAEVGKAAAQVQLAKAEVVKAQDEVSKAAAQVALAAAEVVLAKAEAANAAQSAINAADSASQAAQSVNEAQAIADQLRSEVPYGEAPSDGKTYGRNDGAWVVVEGVGGGGIGTVTSVNGVAPNAQGDVVIDIPEVPYAVSQLANDAGYITRDDLPTQEDIPKFTSQLTNDSGFITAQDVPAAPTKLSELENDAGYAKVADIPAPAVIDVTEAPKDGKQYARKDGAWSEVTGGGSEQPPVQPMRKFIYFKPEQRTNNPQLTKVAFNYAMYNAIKEKGAFFWNDADTMNAVDVMSNWVDAVYDPRESEFEALDIRCFRVYSLDTDGSVKGHSGAIWNGSAWEPGNAFLGIVGQIIGEFSDSVVSSSSVRTYLPAGNWFYPSIIQKFSNGNQQGLPTAQIGTNHCVVNKLHTPFGGSANFPFAAQDVLKLTWLSNGAVSKGEYYFQQRTATWINTGLGTA